MKPGTKNSYKALKTININGSNYKYYSLIEAENNGLKGISKEILESKSLVSKLKNKVSFYKIGLRTFVVDGFNLVDEIKECGKKVFLDLKLYDIKSTIQETVSRISEHANE